MLQEVWWLFVCLKQCHFVKFISWQSEIALKQTSSTVRINASESNIRPQRDPLYYCKSIA